MPWTYKKELAQDGQLAALANPEKDSRSHAPSSSAPLFELGGSSRAVTVWESSVRVSEKLSVGESRSDSVEVIPFEYVTDDVGDGVGGGVMVGVFVVEMEPNVTERVTDVVFVAERDGSALAVKEPRDREKVSEYVKVRVRLSRRDRDGPMVIESLRMDSVTVFSKLMLKLAVCRCSVFENVGVAVNVADTVTFSERVAENCSVSVNVCERLGGEGDTSSVGEIFVTVKVRDGVGQEKVGSEVTVRDMLDVGSFV